MYYYERLRDLREDADLTQKEAGAILNTTQQQYAKYELGVQEIPTHHLLRLAEYYHVSMDYHRPCGLGGYADPESAPDMEYRTEEAVSAKEQQKINALRCEFLKAFVFLSD